MCFLIYTSLVPQRSKGVLEAFHIGHVFAHSGAVQQIEGRCLNNCVAKTMNDRTFVNDEARPFGVNTSNCRRQLGAVEYSDESSLQKRCAYCTV